MGLYIWFCFYRLVCYCFDLWVSGLIFRVWWALCVNWGAYFMLLSFEVILGVERFLGFRLVVGLFIVGYVAVCFLVSSGFVPWVSCVVMI